MTMQTTETEEAPSLDSVCSAIADENRRAALRLLNRAGGEAMGLDTLAEAVADRVDSGGLSDDEHRHRIRIALHQIHLPKLEHYGLVCYDTETKQARSTTEELSQELLAAIEPYEASE